MLRVKENDQWPSVVLMDYGGIMQYYQQKEVEHTVKLVRTMINKEKTIPRNWRSETFKESDLELADSFYKEMCDYGLGGRRTCLDFGRQKAL